MFAGLAEARAVIERWRRDYNQVRPHSAHGGLTPEAAHLRSAGARAAMNNQDSHSYCGTGGERVSRHQPPPRRAQRRPAALLLDQDTRPGHRQAESLGCVDALPLQANSIGARRSTRMFPCSSNPRVSRVAQTSFRSLEVQYLASLSATM